MILDGELETMFGEDGLGEGEAAFRLSVEGREVFRRLEDLVTAPSVKTARATSLRPRGFASPPPRRRAGRTPPSANAVRLRSSRRSRRRDRGETSDRCRAGGLHAVGAEIAGVSEKGRRIDRLREAPALVTGKGADPSRAGAVPGTASSERAEARREAVTKARRFMSGNRNGPRASILTDFPEPVDPQLRPFPLLPQTF